MPSLSMATASNDSFSREKIAMPPSAARPRGWAWSTRQFAPSQFSDIRESVPASTTSRPSTMQVAAIERAGSSNRIWPTTPQLLGSGLAMSGVDQSDRSGLVWWTAYVRPWASSAGVAAIRPASSLCAEFQLPSTPGGPIKARDTCRSARTPQTSTMSSASLAAASGDRELRPPPGSASQAGNQVRSIRCRRCTTPARSVT